jgi:hypothetical protein
MTLKISVPKPPPAPTLPADIAPDVAVIQEKYPRIGNRIALLWGSAELQKFLNELIFDARGDRQGFPPDAAEILLRIHRYHGKLVPEDERYAWNKVIS